MSTEERFKALHRKLENKDGAFGFSSRVIGVEHRASVMGGKLTTQFGAAKGGVGRFRYHKLVGAGQFELKGEARFNGKWSSQARYHQQVGTKGAKVYMQSRIHQDDATFGVGYERKLGRGKLSFDAAHSRENGFSAGIKFSIPLGRKQRRVKKVFDKLEKRLARDRRN